MSATSRTRRPVAGHGQLSRPSAWGQLLKILGIAKLPPDATINFFLFGDPGSTGSLGWYAAYIAKDA